MNKLLEQLRLRIAELDLTTYDHQDISDILNALQREFNSLMLITPANLSPKIPPVIPDETGNYDSLSDVLTRAFDQASKGKGKERHAQDLPFENQPMQQISKLVGSPDGMSYQAIKKIQESIRLPTKEMQSKELLGAIVYIAGIIIYLEKDHG